MKKVIIILLVIATISAGLIFLNRDVVNSEVIEPEVGTTEVNENCKTHTVVVENNQFHPNEVNGKYCDELVIENRDDRNYLIAFGEHDEHTPYGEFEEEVISSDESLTINLVHRGVYRFHDHNNDEMAGVLRVE